jgi:hypothetical protein
VYKEEKDVEKTKGEESREGRKKEETCNKTNKQIASNK